MHLEIASQISRKDIIILISMMQKKSNGQTILDKNYDF